MTLWVWCDNSFLSCSNFLNSVTWFDLLETDERLQSLLNNYKACFHHQYGCILFMLGLLEGLLEVTLTVLPSLLAFVLLFMGPGSKLAVLRLLLVVESTSQCEWSSNSSSLLILKSVSFFISFSNVGQLYILRQHEML